MMIRHASPDDAPAISQLAAQVQELHFENDPQRYKSAEPAASVAWFRAQLSAAETVAFIAEERGRALGYVITSACSTEGNAVKHRADFVELSQIGVADGHRGRGIGRALHERVVEHWIAAGATEIRLTVIAFNTAARSYYEGLGFSEMSRRMSLRLPKPRP